MILTAIFAVGALAPDHLARPLSLQRTAVAVNHKKLPASKDKFDLVALGDNRPAGAYLPPTRVFKSLIRDVGMIGPSFVISSGDLIFGKTEPVSQFKVEAKQIQAILGTLPCPFFNAPGNHEINDRQEYYDEYVKTFGPTYGSFKFGNFTFLQVSTEEVGSSPGIAEAEKNWMKGIFAQPGPKIAFQHHPVVGRKSNPSPEVVDDADQIAAFYKEGGVKYVFQGHDHAFDHQVVDGVEYFLSGGAGAPLDAEPKDGGFFHFLLVHVDGDSLTADVIPAGALELTQTPEGVTLGNYADYDLPMGNVVVFTKRMPRKAEGIVQAKKLSKVKIKIVSVTPVTGGYNVRLSFTAVKHRATAITFKY